MRAMRQGEFAAAWEMSDAALRARAGVPYAELPRHLQSVWDGTPLRGKRVLIRCYHGLGDTIQFIRYASMVRAVAAEVIVWAQPVLLELLRGVRGIDRLLPLHDGRPDVDYDVDVEIMELPHVFRSTLATLPAEVPYIRAAPVRVCDAEVPPGLAVGVIWRAGDWDELRSVPVALLGSLAGLPGVRLHALQRGRGLEAWRGEFGVVSASDRAEETAGIMQAMDLVISVDSFPAHLAGALGRPTWTLLHSAADWRWMEDRDDSPWYPTMRLYRQPQPGDWEAVIARVREDLRDLIPSPGINPS